MKRVQGKNVVGYVTIQITGKNLEVFFQTCANAKIPIWDVTRIDEYTCEAKVYLHSMSKVKQIAEHYNDEITQLNRSGLVHHMLNLWARKEIIISIVVSCLILFVLSNIVWKINITGVSVDVEKKIDEQLTAHGLYEGAWSYSFESLDIIQQKILNSVPELLYIGIEKKGTTYHVDAVEKLIVKEPEKKQNQHLVAAKNGIIKKMFIKEGQPVVNVHDFVKKGDRLVSGIIEEENMDENEENKLEEVENKTVSANGEVYANTWYEVNVTSSLKRNHHKLPGDKMIKHYLKVKDFYLPIWGFKKIPFEHYVIEKEEKKVKLLKWEIPLIISENTIYHQEDFTETRTVEEAKEQAINHVKNDLKLKLGTEAEILKYYVLHESEESGKVKLNLYISVLEDIATAQPIH